MQKMTTFAIGTGAAKVCDVRLFRRALRPGEWDVHSGLASAQGPRPTMEDRHTAVDDGQLDDVAWRHIGRRGNHSYTTRADVFDFEVAIGIGHDRFIAPVGREQYAAEIQIDHRDVGASHRLTKRIQYLASDACALVALDRQHRDLIGVHRNAMHFFERNRRRRR